MVRKFISCIKVHVFVKFVNIFLIASEIFDSTKRKSNEFGIFIKIVTRDNKKIDM